MAVCLSNTRIHIVSNITRDKIGKKKGIQYTGGRVLEPVAGMHFGAKTYDVSSMYPSMSIVHNISSETVNCECCKTDSKAKIPPEVMQEINKELRTPRPWGTYWICKTQRGKLSMIMEDLKIIFFVDALFMEISRHYSCLVYAYNPALRIHASVMISTLSNSL